MMSDIKLISLDLDGTLLDPNGKVSDYTFEVIKRLTERGIKFVINTGRIFSLLEHEKELLEHFPYVISSNGAQIFDAQHNWKVIHETCIPQDFTLGVIDILRKHNQFFYIFYHDNRLLYSSADEEIIEKYVPEIKGQERPLISDGGIDFSKCLKFGLLGEPHQLKESIQEIKEHYSESIAVEAVGPHTYDITSSKTNKASGIEILLEKFNLTYENLMAIGDSENDISILEKSKVPVIMSNALEQIKKPHYFIANTNSNDGVGHFLRNWYHLFL